ncbi:hypothetical protein CEXT_392871 [Caerostris extrusa]|uniref:Uncharacterized protein n=1 Tax=Caerostris extrusa TaxID=172846 RepID=A0AAV4MW52_CAEEX|nr:hypothetical protein CEXT_392871 [Caerostris extrusa]
MYRQPSGENSITENTPRFLFCLNTDAFAGRRFDSPPTTLFLPKVSVVSIAPGFGSPKSIRLSVSPISLFSFFFSAATFPTSNFYSLHRKQVGAVLFLVMDSSEQSYF